MAPHSSTPAWKLTWTEEPGRLQSMGSLRVGHDWATSLSLSCIGEGMATHSSVLAWRIPGTGEPGGLPSMRSHSVGHDWSDLAAAGACEWVTEVSGYWSFQTFGQTNGAWERQRPQLVTSNLMTCLIHLSVLMIISICALIKKKYWELLLLAMRSYWRFVCFFVWF